MKSSMIMSLLLAVGFSLSAAAQHSDGLSVIGIGRVDAKPTRLEIAGNVTGKAELAADAMVKFKDAKRRGLEVINGLKIEGLTVVERGVSIAQMGGMDAQTARMMGRQNVSSTPEVTVSEKVTIGINEIDKLEDTARVELVAKVLDAATDASFSAGTAQMTYNRMQTGQLNEVVTFVVPNGQDFIDQATKKAIEDARKQAEKVAALSNVTLGKIQSISISMGANPAGQKVNYYNPYGFNAQGGKSSADSRRLSSREFMEIPVVMKAHIKFEIVD